MHRVRSESCRSGLTARALPIVMAAHGSMASAQSTSMTAGSHGDPSFANHSDAPPSKTVYTRYRNC